MDFEKSQMEGRKLPAGDHVEKVLLQEDGLFLARGSGPVSYTHLDVYKRQAKISAIKDTIWRVANYRRQGIVSELVHTIFVKRMQLIGNAGTVSELKEIQAEPKPHYNGNGFSTGTFCIPEEEPVSYTHL